jgi:hypothetical protein
MQGGRSYSASVWVLLAGTITQASSAVAAASEGEGEPIAAAVGAVETGREEGIAGDLRMDVDVVSSSSSSDPSAAGGGEVAVAPDGSLDTSTLSSSSSESSSPDTTSAAAPASGAAATTWATVDSTNLSSSNGEVPDESIAAASTSASVTLSLALATSPFTALGSAIVTVTSTTTWVQLRLAEFRVPDGGPWEVMFTVRVAAPGQVLLDDASLGFFTPAPGKQITGGLIGVQVLVDILTWAS